MILDEGVGMARLRRQLNLRRIVCIKTKLTCVGDLVSS